MEVMLTDLLKAMAQASFVFATNEDDFGIFLQGFLTGVMVLVPKIDAPALTPDPDAGPEGFEAMVKLYALYLQNKTKTEIRMVDVPPHIKGLRDQTIKMIEPMAKKML